MHSLAFTDCHTCAGHHRKKDEGAAVVSPGTPNPVVAETDVITNPRWQEEPTRAGSAFLLDLSLMESSKRHCLL